MKKFTIADLHFGHENVLKYEPIRSKLGNTVEEMDAALIKRWNSIVSKEDHVYINGDVSFYDQHETKEILALLNGHKHLIVGNHDFHFTHTKLLGLGFSSVQNELKLRLSKDVTVKMSHFPYLEDSSESFEKGKYDMFRPKKEEGVWLIHGHSHSKGTKFNPTLKSICVSCELWNFNPINLDNLVNMIRKEEAKGDK